LELGPQDEATRKALAGREASDLRKAIQEARAAMTNIKGASLQLNQLISGSKAPIQQFTETGLVELSYAIRELRQLTANLNIIAAKIERDPAGFIFSGKQGYVPK
jgi:phospholipid/cholesterol/gamma-HCH transport system substrate-binding protein